MKLLLASSTSSLNATSPMPEQISRSTAQTGLTGAAAKRAAQDERLHPLVELQNELGDRNGGPWAGQHLPYTICGTLLAAVALAAVLAYVIIKRRRKAASSPVTTPEPPKQQTILKDSPKFTVHLTTQSPQTQQNGAPTVPVQEPSPKNMPPISSGINRMDTTVDSISTGFPNACNGGAKMIPLNAPIQPIRIKAKGLLDRRGSNVSLTIDVNPIVIDSLHMATPPKECSAIEYLSSAGNRMTRRQLRTCLKDTKTLQQEFLDIPLNHPKKFDMPGCSNKNRYKSIWPNETTRVILPLRNRRRSSASETDIQSIDQRMNAESSCQVTANSSSEASDAVVPNGVSSNESNSIDMEEDESSTYINANYIRGLNSDTKSYIAAQGPLPNTIDDFWSMIWNEQCPCVVMMTRLKENNRVKCELYLPNRDAQYGDVRVTVKSTITKNGYTIRDLHLECDDEIRQIKHFWFTGWPDHKAPTSTAKQLIELVQDVDAERQRQWGKIKGQQESVPLVGPVLVHCSAGLGRTGCFIATSMGMKQLRDENMADILGIVCQLRLDRGGMIQTVEQYEFIHHALIQYEKQLPESPSSLPPPPTPLSSNGSNSRSGSRHEMPVF